MQARSALFDLYGDYLRPRGGRAPVAALVRLLGPLDIAAPAVRTAVSRMVRQGWLVPLRLPGGPGYQLTVKAVHRLDEAAARIYRTARQPWNGRFDLVLLAADQRHPDQRHWDQRHPDQQRPDRRRPDRSRLTATLSYLGYGPLDGATWVSPRPAEDIDALLTETGVSYDRFSAVHAAGDAGAAALVRRAWDLATVGEAYQTFVADHTPAMTAVGPDSDDQAAYAARFRLVHAWRTFLFRDPQLPSTLLPEHWPGTRAAAFFDRHEARLRPAADRFVDRCLAPSKGP